MEVEKDQMLVTVTYKLKKYTAEVPVDATVGFLGKQLSELTGVVLHTMRLLVPKVKRFSGSTVVQPASELHSSATLVESGITSSIVIKMMGVTTEEMKEVMEPVKENRVLGFAEEEERRRARRQPATQADAKSRLPKGPYTFHEFRVLDIPNLNPPPAKARDLLYKLASDRGIERIMNKHKWQVGILSELAPKGYVGISPKCLLGQNMNRGQDISLRLRTDDFQGFRKYGSIKKTLLHELAHMVHDEHDEHFHALDKQLNQEAIELDWTNTPGRTLSGVARRGVEDDDEPMDAGGVSGGFKLGGGLPPTPNARSAAVHAARIRFEQNKLASDTSKIYPSESVIQGHAVENINEPDPDENAAADEIAITAEGTAFDGRGPHDNQKGITEPDPDESTSGPSVHASLPVLRDREPDPDDSQDKTDLQACNTSIGIQEPDPDDMLTLSDWIKTVNRKKPTIVEAEPDPDESMSVREERNPDESTQREPDPDESSHRDEPDPDKSMHHEEPDPDESMHRDEPDPDESSHREEPDPDESLHRDEPDPDESMHREEPDPDESMHREEPDPDESLRREEPDPDESMDSEVPVSYESVNYDPGVHGNLKYDLNVEQLNEELMIILGTASAAAIRLQQAVVHIMQQATPAETTTALKTLSTIMSNLIDNPNEVKYKTIRKTNHRFQNQIGRFEGAVQFLREVGFSEGTSDGSDCLVLKASDPGLLWLAFNVLQPPEA